jgi:hypothetical protein
MFFLQGKAMQSSSHKTGSTQSSDFTTPNPYAPLQLEKKKKKTLSPQKAPAQERQIPSYTGPYSDEEYKRDPNFSSLASHHNPPPPGCIIS